jgi:hypothetical protein
LSTCISGNEKASSRYIVRVSSAYNRKNSPSVVN